VSRRQLKLYLLLATAVCIAIVLARSREPRYQGKTLTSWLQRLDEPSSGDQQRLEQVAQVATAVRAIGARKALPVLLDLARAHDGPIRLWIFDHHDRWPMSAFKMNYANFSWNLAEYGFRALDTNGAPAVGDLAKLLDDDEHAVIAIRCLDGIGKPAESALLQGLTNNLPEVRAESMCALASATDDVDVYIDRIKPGLIDTSDYVRVAAVHCIGIQHKAPERAVPLLIHALHDASDDVQSQAAGLLAGFGTNALSAVPDLARMVEDGAGGAANAAANALGAIAPDQSLPLLLKAAEHGSPPAALDALTTTAPSRALAIILARVQSPEPLVRSDAVRRLCAFPLKTPEVQAAIEHAAFDQAKEVAREARNCLRDQFLKSHPNGPEFPNEPAFGGKRLGEWLKTPPQPDGSFSKDAQDALRQMGTNVIPALLDRLAFRIPPANVVLYEVNFQGVRAFITLGPQARSALPKLNALMDSNDESLALHAMLATLGMGPDSMPSLLKGLTNQFAMVRSEAAHYLSEGIVPQNPEQRKQVVSLIAKLLDDPDLNVRQSATNELLEIDPVAATEAGIVRPPPPRARAR
jgi:HEAT repeat protein